MSFFKPFFFLLVDSLLESLLVAAGWAFAWAVPLVAAAGAVCAGDASLCEDVCAEAPP